jgi:hypothetical protein
MVTENNS